MYSTVARLVWLGLTSALRLDLIWIWFLFFCFGAKYRINANDVNLVFKVVSLLLCQGADPNARDNWNYTPLHEAAIKGKIDVCIGERAETH